MTGETHYYKIPLLTKLFNIKFYRQWRDDKFYSLGFKKERVMSLGQCIARLEAKRIRQEQYKNGSIFPTR
jgi:hypothetical protein